MSRSNVIKIESFPGFTITHTPIRIVAYINFRSVGI